MTKAPYITEAEEQELIALSESDEWVSVGNIEQQRKWWQEVAKNHIDGERERISISIPKRNLTRLKTIAAEEGIPYQTLINSILHKYVSR